MERETVKWDDLRVFLEVARQGSVQAAAKRLNLDHSTVCRRIDKLEHQLSMKLLDRSSRGIALREGVQHVLRHIEGMEQHASSFSEAVAGSAAPVVRIATMEGIASCYLARRVSLLDRFAPNVEIELVSIPQPVDLSRKEADIFLSFFDPQLTGLSSRRLGEFALFLHCAPEYIRRHGRPSCRAELGEHLFIDYIEDLLAIDAVRWLHDAVQSPRVGFRSNSIIAQCNAAVAGAGIVMLPTFVGTGVEGLIRLVPDEVCVRRDVWVSTRTEQAELRRIRSVLRFLTTILELDRDFLMGRVDRLVPA